MIEFYTSYEPSKEEAADNAIKRVRLGILLIVVFFTVLHTLYHVRQVLNDPEHASYDQVDGDEPLTGAVMNINRSSNKQQTFI